MISHLKGRLLAASAVLCIALPLTAAAQNNFNFNTTVDFADANPMAVNVIAGCVDGTGSNADIAEADGAVALNVAGYTDGVECLATPSAIPALYNVVPSAGCIIAATPADQADSDCTLLFEPITVDINIQSTENSVDPVVAGSGPGNMSFTFTVTNDGANDATGVIADFTINITGFVTGVCDGQVDTGTLTDLTWDIGDLASGAAATATFDLDCEISAASDHNSTYELILDLTSVDQVDSDSTNDSSSQMATIIRQATFDVTKIWDGGSVTATLTCSDGYTDSGSTPLSFTHSGFVDGVNCVVTETIPDGYSPSYSADCDVTGVLSGSTYSCEITNAETLARFHVTKTFSDGSVHDVDVEITCDDGLPLTNSATITSGDLTGVNFVVTDFIHGTLNCDIAETSTTPGYEPSAGCSFTDVTSGDFECPLTNAAEDGTFTANMEWIIPTESGDEVDEEVEVTITCDSAIDGTVEDNGYWSKTATLGDGDSMTATVDTTLGSASCEAVQGSLPSGVEPSSSGCGPRTVSAGDSVSCTFTNTVFFEGIPTLSQYGLALLALLMLGVGMVGFRRFA